MDAAANFCYGTVLTPPSPATSGTSMEVTLLGGCTLPTAPWNAFVWITGFGPLQSNAEIVRVTSFSMAGAVATLTIVRAQESTSARTIVVGDQFGVGPTAKLVSDLNAILVPFGEDQAGLVSDPGTPSGKFLRDDNTFQTIAGSGTVTTVSVATANGFSGSVTNPTTTPAITIVAGAITPTSVNGVVISGSATPTLAVSGTTSVSGTNTGDQTNITGNAATVTTNANLTGPVTSVGNATAITDAAVTLAKMANLAQDQFIGRTTGSTGVPETATITAAARTVLDDTTVAAMVDTLGGASSTGTGGIVRLIAPTMQGHWLQDENSALQLDSALSADGKYCGVVEAGTAGATLAFGDLVYLAASDSRWELTDADAEATAGPVKIGICVLAAAADGDPTTILLWGKVRADAAFPALTISAPVYVGTTAGDVQTAQPSGSDDVIRIIGYGNTADELFFRPSNDYMVHT